MNTIRLTSKRQATLPKALCDEMHLKPGDYIRVKRTVVDGKPAWILEPQDTELPEWFGTLRRYARGKSHDMSAVRRSISKARSHGGT